MRISKFSNIRTPPIYFNDLIRSKIFPKFQYPSIVTNRAEENKKKKKIFHESQNFHIESNRIIINVHRRLRPPTPSRI